MILPTKILKGMVDEITSMKQYNAVKMKLMIRNHQDTSFDIDDATIDAIIFEQNFALNTADNIQLHTTMNSDQLRKLVASSSDLFTDIVLEYIDGETGSVMLDEDPVMLHYKVFVHDLSTITKRFGVQAFTNVDGEDTPSNTSGAVRIPVAMQLMTDNDYTINRASFTGMIRNLNVEDTVKYMASVMGIKNIKMVPSDNQTKYQHMVIPPDKSGFREVFDYVHKKYGVYSNGFRHYITDGTLYVYPPFDMKSEQKPQLQVLRVSENSYGGSNNYHKLEDNKNLSIISNSKLDSKTLSNVGSENDGNTKLFVRSDGVFDAQVDPDTMELRNVTASMSSSQDQTISKGSATAKYVKPTMNLHSHASTFSESNTELLSFSWNYARINMIYPGMTTTFLFDEKNVVMSRQGLVEAVSYSMTRKTKDVFNCEATLVIRLDPKQVPYDK